MFDKFTYLKELDLRKSEISLILSFSFDMLANLSSLHLKGVKMMPPFLFKNLNNLKELSLLECKALLLSKKHFDGLNNLESFKYGGQLAEEIDNLTNLKKMSLHTLIFDKFTFKGLDKLESLDLKEVVFTLKTPKDLFKNLKNLKIFNFHKISKKFTPHLVNYGKRYEYYQSDLILIKEIFQSISSNIETFDCKSDVFEALNSCSTPFIYGLRSLEIQLFNEINFMDFCLFKENIFPNLETLILTNTHKNNAKIPTSCTLNIKMLKTLKLRGSYLVDYDNSFNYLTEASFYLKLPFNISIFSNLKILTLEYFSEAIILNESFLENLINLEDLKLSMIVTSIDSDARYLFKTLVKLKKLTIGTNRIVTLKSTYFDYLTNLEKLILKNNQIKIIEPGTFKNLNKLRHLDLSKNNIEYLDKTMLDGLFNLEILNLHFGTLGVYECIQLKKDALSQMNKLEKVSFDLTYNDFDIR